MVRLAVPRLVKQLQRLTAGYAYGDLGYLVKQIGTGVFDENNTETMSTLEIPVECAFTDKPSTEIWRDYADIGQIDAEVRFAGHDPNKADTFKIASRFDGTGHSDETFEVIGISNRYTFGYVLALRKVAV
jgi:hypothetical protein